MRQRTIAPFSLLIAVLASGFAMAHADTAPRSFTVQGYETAGAWHLESTDGAQFIVLSKDFKTSDGPDLKIFLSPQAIGTVNGTNVTKKALRVAKLKSNKGAQRYKLPAGTDLKRFKSLAIHCEKYSKLFAASSLR